MTVRPIIFSGPMVRAILDGRKTQTRRVLRPQPVERPGKYCRRLQYRDAKGRPLVDVSPEGPNPWLGTPYAPGDLLWVRETWAMPHGFDMAQASRHMLELLNSKGRAAPVYRATDNPNSYAWRSPIHMPRWASRLTLRVIDVRVQRVQEISEADIAAEGWVKCTEISDDPEVHRDAARDWFMDTWDSINAKRGFGWEANPWVVAVTFKAIRENVDKVAP